MQNIILYAFEDEEKVKSKVLEILRNCGHNLTENDLFMYEKGMIL